MLPKPLSSSDETHVHDLILLQCSVFLRCHKTFSCAAPCMNSALDLAHSFQVYLATAFSQSFPLFAFSWFDVFESCYLVGAPSFPPYAGIILTHVCSHSPHVCSHFEYVTYFVSYYWLILRVWIDPMLGMFSEIQI